MTATEALHKAAQYIAAAGKSFVQPKVDDSHTSLYWSSHESSMVSQPLNDEGLRLELNHAVYAIDVVHPDSGLSASFPLKGARHLDILSWLDREREFCGIKTPYNYDLHYQLGYAEPLDDHVKFPGISRDELDIEIARRDAVDEALKAIQREFGIEDPIRIWPHHFDSALLWKEPQVGLISSIGIGMAIPDTLNDEHYLYISAYNGHEAIDTSSNDPLPKGRWHSNGWNGATFRLDEPASPQEAFEFFKHAISSYLDR